MIGDAVAPAGQKGITYLVVGGGGANLRYISSKQPEWSVARNNKVHGFLDVDVTGGTLLARLLTPEGEVVDSFTLTKQLPPEEPPRINLIVEGQRGVAPHQALFRAELPSPGVAVRWDFGDGATSEGAEVKHTYAQPGEYTVTATATASTGGASSTSTAQVSVSAPGTGGTPTDPEAPNPGGPQPPMVSLPGTESGASGESSSAGCSAVPMGALLPLGALMVAGFLRRRRR
jgi:uncharacterized protein (TIGR03382 family)